MIVETAVISVAAIIVASLMTANAIHKRAVAAEDVDAEVQRVLERRRERFVAALNSWNNHPEKERALKARSEWGHAIDSVDDELIKLARGEFQVPRDGGVMSQDIALQQPQDGRPSGHKA